MSVLRERPMIFSAEEVQAIRDGRKTQTRRVVKPQPRNRNTTAVAIAGDGIYEEFSPRGLLVDTRTWRCPYGQPGSRLWVREGFYTAGDNKKLLGYVADSDHPHGEPYYKKPPIHMPRWASRLTLTLTDVRVERVQEISEKDVAADGIEVEFHAPGSYGISDPCATGTVTLPGGTQVWSTALECYRRLWDSLNAKRGYGWDVNPWVWVLSFLMVTSNG